MGSRAKTLQGSRSISELAGQRGLQCTSGLCPLWVWENSAVPGAPVCHRNGTHGPVDRKELLSAPSSVRKW